MKQIDNLFDGKRADEENTEVQDMDVYVDTLKIGFHQKPKRKR